MRLSDLLQGWLERLGARSGKSFAVRLPGGRRLLTGLDEPRFTIVFHDRPALIATILRGHMGLLEAYFDGRVDVEGNLSEAFAAGIRSRFDRQFGALDAVGNRWHEWRHSNKAIAQAKINARLHYGLSTDFYRLWLDDPLMMYTCAYWSEGTQTIEEAQRNKIDHVCRKIRLAEGERYIDIGCGFGGFMFRALETCGALGTGLNTTTEQADWLRDEIQARGLSGKLNVIEADFREVGESHEKFDKVVSIGVLEHAGPDQLAEVVRAHADFLRPGGMGMLHFIGHVDHYETELFIRKHVFPGGWIPSLAEVIVAMERCGLEVVDIENLRRHYAPTLDAWSSRFEARWDEIQALDPQRFNERFRRVWHSYLIGCAEMFRSPSGYTHLFQIVFSKGNITRTSYPMTRAHLYGR